MSDQIDDSELLDIAKTPEHARVLRKALRQLAESSSNEVLREMAEEVLSGRIGLREAAHVRAYADAMSEQVRSFVEKMRDMSYEEAEELRRRAAQELEKERRVAETEGL